MLENHIHTQGMLGFDEFAHRVVLLKQPPWDASSGPWQMRPFNDSDEIQVTRWLQLQDIDISKPNAFYAAKCTADACKFHPVRRYLEGLPEHDRAPRLETWLTTLYGAADTPYVRGAARMSLVGAVARIFEPGCKHDCMLILSGMQGPGKSSGLAALFGQEWFTDDLSVLSSKDAKIELQGKWCIEISELAAIRRTAGRESTKSFLSRQVEHYVPKYSNSTVDIPRQCVIFGTTNEVDFLTDPTGNRRFWPIRVAQAADVNLIRERRSQMWAEALAAYRARVPWWPTPGDEFSLALAEQHENFLEEDTWQEPVERFVYDKLSVSVGDVLQHSKLDILPGDQTKGQQMRIGHILTGMGWQRRRISVDPVTRRRRWVYFRPTDETKKQDNQTEQRD
jgi:putative DNA primase/helicase